MKKKHAILSMYADFEWSLNLGGAAYIDVTSGVLFIEALDEVSNMGWDVISVYTDGDKEKALVAMDYKEYVNIYGE